MVFLLWELLFQRTAIKERLSLWKNLLLDNSLEWKLELKAS